MVQSSQRVETAQRFTHLGRNKMWSIHTVEYYLVTNME